MTPSWFGSTGTSLGGVKILKKQGMRVRDASFQRNDSDTHLLFAPAASLAKASFDRSFFFKPDTGLSGTPVLPLVLRFPPSLLAAELLFPEVTCSCKMHAEATS